MEHSACPMARPGKVAWLVGRFITSIFSHQVCQWYSESDRMHIYFCSIFTIEFHGQEFNFYHFSLHFPLVLCRQNQVRQNSSLETLLNSVCTACLGFPTNQTGLGGILLCVIPKEFVCLVMLPKKNEWCFQTFLMFCLLSLLPTSWTDALIWPSYYLVA